MTGEKPLETLSIFLECDGLTIKGFFVPSFRIGAGQAICMHVRLPAPAWHEDVLPVLMGQTVHSSLRFHGTIAYSDRPRPRRRWWGGLRSSSVGDWLTAEKGLTSSEAAAVLGLVGEPADLSVGRIGWNERTLLALEASLLHPPDLLVFDTCGNDWLTIHHIFERLASRPSQLALVYLKTRFERNDPCLPGAACLELVRTPSPAIIAE